MRERKMNIIRLPPAPSTPSLPSTFLPLPPLPTPSPTLADPLYRRDEGMTAKRLPERLTPHGESDPNGERLDERIGRRGEGTTRLRGEGDDHRFRK